MQATINQTPVTRWNNHSARNSHSAAASQQSVHVLSVLSSGEQKELAACEAVIQKGWQTFVDVGKALARIRDNKLYRAEYDTFEAYCRAKWQYAKSHAYRLIGAAEVFAHLSPIGDIPSPTHEAQVRPLIGMEPQKAQAVWKKAIEKAGGATVTEKQVRQAVAESVGRLQKRAKRKMGIAQTGDYTQQLLGTALKLLKQTEDLVRKEEGVKAVLSLLDRLRECLKDLSRPRFQ